jgi:hypothetical protein
MGSIFDKMKSHSVAKNLCVTGDMYLMEGTLSLHSECESPGHCHNVALHSKGYV